MPRLTREDVRTRILHRDEDLIVLDKPAGIAVHRGPGGGETLDQFFDALRFGADRPPELAHRLDKDTSGCLVLGRHREALARLGRQFRDGRIRKTYWAILMGCLPEAQGRIDAPLARRSHDKRSWWMKVDDGGDPSTTLWRVLGEADGLTFVELSPLTGRTHQLRVHMAHLNAPIAGDHVYGGDRATAAARHLQLHARAIALPRHDQDPLVIVAPPPEHMHPLLGACGWTG